MNKRCYRGKRILNQIICILMTVLLSSALTGAVQKPQESTRFNVGVAIVVDVSGSMLYPWTDGVRMDSAKDAALDLLNLIKIENERSEINYQVALIKFSNDANIVQSLSSDFALLDRKIRDLSAAGGTNIGDGLEKAYNQLDLRKFDRSYVVLLSDGVTNAGRTSSEILDWLRNKHRRVVPKDLLPQASVYGFDYKDGVNTINRARFASDSLRKAGYDVEFFNNFQRESRGLRLTSLDRLNRDQFFSFNGHANRELLGFYKMERNSMVADYFQISNIRNYQLTQMKLSVLAGCKTGSKLNNHDNISHAFVQRGAQSSMGFMDYVNNNGMTAWLEYFYRHLLTIDNPRSVYDAYRLAVSDYDFKLYRVSRSIQKYGYQYYYAILPQLYFQNDAPVYLIETEDDAPKIEEPDDFNPRIYTIGLGDQDHFDENLLRNIAQITNGKYFHGSQPFGLTNSFLATQHHGTGEVVAEIEGKINPEEVLNAGTINLEKRQAELRISLNWPGSHIDLQLVDPAGKIVDENYRGLKVWRSERPSYLVLDRPRAGEWSVLLHGKEVSLDGTSYYVVASVGDVVGRVYDETLLFLVIFAALLLFVMILAPALFGPKDTPFKGGKS